MTVEELEDKHSKIIGNNFENSEEELFEGEFEYWLNKQKKHTKLSIQFAIEVLEEIVKSYKEDIDQETRNLTEWGLDYRGCSLDTLDGLNYKIQELKKYLNEKV